MGVPMTKSDSAHASSMACQHDYAKAVRLGRCHYVCPKCRTDISIVMFLMWEAELDPHELSISDKLIVN